MRACSALILIKIILYNFFLLHDAYRRGILKTFSSNPISRESETNLPFSIHRSRYLFRKTDFSVSNHMPYLLMLAPTSETSPNLRPRVIALPFDFDDILNEEGLSLTRDRYYEMKRIFSTLNSTVVQNVARTYPILLALQSQQLECAKNKIVENLPNVSFEYIFQQKSAGLEFFVACASSEFNFTKQIASLRGTSGLDDPILLQEFIRRVPHALTNRYQVVLSNHISELGKRYGMQRRAVVKAVLKWPRLLNIVNLEAALGRLEISLHKITLTLKTDKEFRRYICTVISTVPRVVGQDVGKKMDALSRLFPDWNLSVMVLENPRLLTQKTEVIIERYKSLCTALGDDIDHVALVNSNPTILLREPVALGDNIRAISKYLPNCTIDILACKYLNLCTPSASKVVVPKLKRIIKLFSESYYVAKCEADADCMTSDVDEISVCTEIIPVQTNSKPVSPVNIVELLNSVGGDRVAAARKLVALWGDVSDANSCGSAMRSSVVDTRSLSSQTLKPKQSTESSILLQARKLAALFIPEEVNGSEHKVKIDEVLEPFDSNSGHTEDVPILNQSNSIDITRIVLANSDEFCENFPWLLKKFSTWVSEYGPSLAYHILNAVPSLWRRSKPESLRRQIKVLYSIAADSTQANTKDSYKNGVMKLYLESPTAKISEPYHRGVGSILFGANSVLRQSDHDIGQRVQLLQKLLLPVLIGDNYTNSTLINVKAILSDIIIRAPRLLTDKESIIKTRIGIMRSLFYRQNRDFVQLDPLYTVINSMCLRAMKVLRVQLSSDTGTDLASAINENPRLLTFPLSVLLRFHLLQYLASPEFKIHLMNNFDLVSLMEIWRNISLENDVSVSLGEFSAILDFNTDDLIRKLSHDHRIDFLDLDTIYSMFLLRIEDFILHGKTRDQDIFCSSLNQDEIDASSSIAFLSDLRESKGIESIDKLYIDLLLERFGRAHHPVRSVIKNTNVISSLWCEKIEYRICGILNDLYD